jgi:hypothetical protein
MKTLITALAVTAILATSAVAKTQKTPATHTHASNSVTHNSVVQHNDSHCGFHYPQTDPDPQVRSQLLLDCKNHESEGTTE